MTTISVYTEKKTNVFIALKSEFHGFISYICNVLSSKKESYKARCVKNEASIALEFKNFTENCNSLLKSRLRYTICGGVLFTESKILLNHFKTKNLIV